MSSSGATATWRKFFREAGIPPQDASDYSQVFTENRIKTAMLGDLTRELLRDMGITAMGDCIAILKHAKASHVALNRGRASTRVSADDKRGGSFLSRAMKKSTPASRMLEHYVRKDSPVSAQTKMSSRLGGGDGNCSVFNRLGDNALNCHGSSLEYQGILKYSTKESNTRAEIIEADKYVHLVGSAGSKNMKGRLGDEYFSKSGSAGIFANEGVAKSRTLVSASGSKRKLEKEDSMVEHPVKKRLGNTRAEERLPAYGTSYLDRFADESDVNDEFENPAFNGVPHMDRERHPVKLNRAKTFVAHMDAELKSTHSDESVEDRSYAAEKMFHENVKVFSSSNYPENGKLKSRRKQFSQVRPPFSDEEHESAHDDFFSESALVVSKKHLKKVDKRTSVQMSNTYSGSDQSFDYENRTNISSYKKNLAKNHTGYATDPVKDNYFKGEPNHFSEPAKRRKKASKKSSKQRDFKKMKLLPLKIEIQQPVNMNAVSSTKSTGKLQLHETCSDSQSDVEVTSTVLSDDGERSSSLGAVQRTSKKPVLKAQSVSSLLKKKVVKLLSNRQLEKSPSKRLASKNLVSKKLVSKKLASRKLPSDKLVSKKSEETDSSSDSDSAGSSKAESSSASEEMSVDESEPEADMSFAESEAEAEEVSQCNKKLKSDLDTYLPEMPPSLKTEEKSSKKYYKKIVKINKKTGELISEEKHLVQPEAFDSFSD